MAPGSKSIATVSMKSSGKFALMSLSVYDIEIKLNTLPKFNTTVTNHSGIFIHLPLTRIDFKFHGIWYS